MMSTFPHSRLFIDSVRSIVISGPHIQVLETQTGNVLYSTARLEDAQKANFLKSGPVRCAEVDATFKYVVTSGEDKQLKVWEVEGLKLLSERELPKKPTDIHLTRDGQTILVSDKFGDIFSYPLQPELVAEAAPSTEAESSKRGALTSHENPSNGKLILGHTSLLTTFLLTEDEKYVVSADRDEHIRVSWFPQGYVVERYCLGHRKYVSALHIPSSSPSTLLSGGGDSVIKLWDWMSGEQLADIPVGDVVERYIRVKAPKNHAEDGDGDKQPHDGKPVKRKGRGRRNRGKGKQVVQEEAEEGGENTVVYVEGERDDVAVQTEAGEDSTEKTADALVEAEQADVSTTVPEESLILALQRIDSLSIPDAGNFVVFNAVGATALYTFKMPSLPVKQTEFVIDALDLGKPIIDFTIGENGYIWVLVDGERQITSAFETENKRSVRLVRWQGGKFAEIDEPIDVAPLFTSLNTTCLLPATAADIKTLDIYSALVSLPKNVDAEHDPMRRGAYDNMEPGTPDVEEEGSSRGVTPQPGAKKGKTREPTQRELARAKKMDAVRAKMQEQNQVKNVGERPTPEGEPDAKKARAEDTGGPIEADVVMAESS